MTIKGITYSVRLVRTFSGNVARDMERRGFGPGYYALTGPRGAGMIAFRDLDGKFHKASDI